MSLMIPPLQTQDRLLGAVVWDGFASQDMGVFDTDRDGECSGSSPWGGDEGGVGRVWYCKFRGRGSPPLHTRMDLSPLLFFTNTAAYLTRTARTACTSALRIVLQYKNQNSMLLQVIPRAS